MRQMFRCKKLKTDIQDIILKIRIQTIEEIIEFLKELTDVIIILLYLTNEKFYQLYNNLHIFLIENDSNETINNIFLNLN